MFPNCKPLAALCAFCAVAVIAIAGGTPPPAKAASTSDSTDNAAEETTKRPAKLAGEKVKGRKIYSRGAIATRLKFEFKGSRKADIVVKAVHKERKLVVKTWKLGKLKPGKRHKITWKGSRDGAGVPPKGDYVFRIRERKRGGLRRGKLPSTPKIQLMHYVFPVPGKVTFGDGWNAGRGHKGVDVFARCGRKLISARGGRVIHRANQKGGAGRYLVIRGAKDGRDLVYMHLKKFSVKNGEKVRAGQKIGKVGATGNANGCHLHFELWKGHWYSGGKASKSAEKQMRRWYAWS